MILMQFDIVQGELKFVFRYMVETILLNYVPFVTLGLTCLRALVP